MNHTPEEFDRLSEEWHELERLNGDPEGFTKEILAKMNNRQLEIERLMDAMPFEYDEDGKVTHISERSKP